jgi:hypothetical protein
MKQLRAEIEFTVYELVEEKILGSVVFSVIHDAVH